MARIPGRARMHFGGAVAVAAIAAALVVPWPPAGHCQQPTLTFGVFGDSHLGSQYADPAVLPWILADMKARGVELVIGVGDTIAVEPLDRPEVVQKRWGEFWEIVRVTLGTEIPVVLAPGDADIARNPRNRTLFKRNRTQAFAMPYLAQGYGVPPSRPEDLHTWFWWERYHFVILDTEAVGQDGERVAGVQLDWVGKHLTDQPRRAGALLTFAVLHRPPFPAPPQKHPWPEERDTLHESFHTLGVPCIFSGHEHHFREATDILQRDRVRYLTTGGAGGPLLPRASYHYVLVRVVGSAYTHEVVPWPGPVGAGGQAAPATPR